MLLSVIALVLGALLVIAGVAFLCWPLALITAGALLVTAGLYFDFDTLKRGGSK